MWFTGIDQHREFCVLTTYGPEGPRVKQARVACSAPTLAAYFGEYPGPHKAVVESTGGWYWLADALAPIGVELVLAHATRLKAIPPRRSRPTRSTRTCWPCCCAPISSPGLT